MIYLLVGCTEAVVMGPGPVAASPCSRCVLCALCALCAFRMHIGTPAQHVLAGPRHPSFGNVTAQL